jgi:hypothetical protein
MEVTFQLTQEDYRHGLRAWQVRSAWRRWNYRLSLIFMIALLVVGLILAIWNATFYEKSMSWFLIALPVVWLFGVWVSPRIQARIQFRRMPSAHSLTTLAISDAGMHMHSDHYDSQIKWPTYIGWSEGKSVFVLFPQPRIYVPIPKRAFSDEQVNEFREILRRNVGQS